jgi:hypothetical protein
VHLIAFIRLWKCAYAVQVASLKAQGSSAVAIVPSSGYGWVRSSVVLIDDSCFWPGSSLFQSFRFPRVLGESNLIPNFPMSLLLDSRGLVRFLALQRLVAPDGRLGCRFISVHVDI